MRQFARWITTHSFTSYDGSFDYQVPLSSVRQPFLLETIRGVRQAKTGQRGGRDDLKLWEAACG